MSSPAATAFDLVGYSGHAGGLDNAATVLAELSESIIPLELEATAALSPVPWAQRLGFIFSLVGADQHADVLSEYVARFPHEYVLLDPGGSKSEALRDARWKLLVNVEVEPDL